MSPQILQPTEPKGFLFLFVLVLWWFIRHQPVEDTEPDDDGGMKTHPVTGRHPHRPRPRPGGRGPRSPRRGPHGDPTPAAPARVRTIKARSRTEHRS